LLEEEDPLRRRAVVVAGPPADARPVEGRLAPDDLLPVHESGLRAPRPVREPLLADSLLLLDDVGRRLVAEQIEMAVAPQDAMDGREQLGQARVGNGVEPVGRETRGGPARAVEL